MAGVDYAPSGATRAPLDIDRESLLELARGANLYQSRFACLRELVQNAVDATLLRLFAERGAESFPTNERSMRDLRAALAAYPIDVRIERIDGEPTRSDDVPRYRLSVADRGIGIAPHDVPHMQRIGSSRLNPMRAALIAAMPEWMRPSGTFGIGLQSVFLVSDEITLRARCMNGAAIDVVMRASEGGTVEVSGGSRQEVGTTAELVVRAAAEDEPGLRLTLERPAQRDWILDPPDDAPLEVARAAVRALAESALVPVRLDGAEVPRPSSDAAIFDPETLVEVTLPETDDGAEDAFDPHGAEVAHAAIMRRAQGWHRGQRVRARYRGAVVQMTVAPIEVPWSYDVHFGSARELLTLSRDGFSRAGADLVKRRVEATLQRVLPDWLDRLAKRDAAPSVRCWLSVHLREKEWRSTDDWRRLAMFRRDDGTIVTLGDLADLGEMTIVSPPERDHAEARRQGLPVQQIMALLPNGERFAVHARQRFRVALPGTQHTGAREQRLHRGHEYTVLAACLHEGLREWTFDEERGPRSWVFCPEEYRALAGTPPSDPYTRGPSPLYLASPWTIRDHVVDLPKPLRWIEWTSTEDGGPPRAPAEVAATLVRFLRDFDPDLRANGKLRVVYDLSTVIAEIESAYPPM